MVRPMQLTSQNGGTDANCGLARNRILYPTIPRTSRAYVHAVTTYSIAYLHLIPGPGLAVNLAATADDLSWAAHGDTCDMGGRSNHKARLLGRSFNGIGLVLERTATLSLAERPFFHDRCNTPRSCRNIA